MGQPCEQLGRIQRLEEELDAVRHRVGVLEGHAPARTAPVSPPPPLGAAPERPASASRRPPLPPPPWLPPAPRSDPRDGYRPPAPQPRPPAPEPRPAPAAPKRAATAPSLEDLIGGRVLPWAGAFAVLLGVAFFVAIAIGRGWLGESARIALAYAGSAVLLGAGAWLYENKGRTQAALAMVGTATAAAFMTTAGAVQLYALFPVALGLTIAFGIGALSTGLALRWGSRTVAGLGILGALASPVLLSAGSSDAGLAFVAVALACATAVLLLRRWDWLAAGAFAVSAPQLMAWSAVERSPVELVAAALVFWALYLTAALGHALLVRRPVVQPVPAVLSLAAPLVAAAGGYWALEQAGHSAAGDWLIAGLGVAHLALAAATRRTSRLSGDLSRLLLAGGVVMGDVAWGLIAEGPLLAIGWSASAVAVGVLATRGRVDREAAGTVLGAQLCLSVLHVLLYQAPPDLALEHMGAGDGAGALASLIALAASAFTCARLNGGNIALRVGFDATAMAALAWVTAFALAGPALAAAWAAQAAGLAAIAAGQRDRVARAGSVAFLALAAMHVLAFDASPYELGIGGFDALTAAIGLGSLAWAAFACARLAAARSDDRMVLHGVTAASVLYLAPFLLDGTLLVAAWAAGALAMAACWQLTREAVAAVAGLASVWLAALHVLVIDAPPVALVDGVDQIALALLAVAAVAAALLAAARLVPVQLEAREQVKLGLETAGAVAAVYGVSVGIVSAFPPDAAALDPAGAGLGVRQQGQMLLSAFWAAAGLAALVWGLLRDERSRRIGGLSLLALALAKAFLYDLAALDSIYRVVSFVALGVLLLVGAFAYQRMRPVAEAH